MFYKGMHLLNLFMHDVRIKRCLLLLVRNTHLECTSFFHGSFLPNVRYINHFFMI